MSPKFFVVLLVIAGSSAASAQSRWGTPIPLPNSGIDLLLVTPDAVYASGYLADDIYKTPDLTSWSTVLPGSDAWELQVVGSEILAAGSNGLFSSLNGTAWTNLMQARVLSVDKVGSTIIAGGYGGQIYRSEDNGATWYTSNGRTMPKGYDDWVEAAFLLEGKALYVHYSRDLLLETGPEAFDLVSTNYSNDMVKTPSGILVRNGRVFSITTNGRSFSAAFTSPAYVWDWSISGDNVIVAADEQEIFVSKNRGITWFNWSEGTTTGYPDEVAIGPDGYAYYIADGLIQKSLEPVATATGRVQEAPVPASAALDVYPNPTDGYLLGRASIPAPGELVIRVFDMLGREVSRSSLGYSEAGVHPVRLDLDLAAGAYVVRMEAGQETRTKTITVVREK